MNIYKIVVGRRGRTTAWWGPYIGQAKNHTDAIKRAFRAAKNEGCEQPVLRSLECLGRSAF